MLQSIIGSLAWRRVLYSNRLSILKSSFDFLRPYPYHRCQRRTGLRFPATVITIPELSSQLHFALLHQRRATFAKSACILALLRNRIKKGTGSKPPTATPEYDTARPFISEKQKFANVAAAQRAEHTKPTEHATEPSPGYLPGGWLRTTWCPWDLLLGAGPRSTLL